MPTTASKAGTLPDSPQEILPLVNGDHLTRDEFERRYAAMPEIKKAELVEGVVYMPSPVNQKKHSLPHAHLVTWLGNYETATPGVEVGDNATVRLDLDNEPQPDVLLMVEAEPGGQTKVDADGYIERAPELVAEVASTSASYDLHDKLNAYRRNGVREYIVWRVLQKEIDWFVLRGGRYERLEPDASGLLRSEVFPGLWLDAAAMIGDDMRTVMKRLEEGLASPQHAEFVIRLRKS